MAKVWRIMCDKTSPVIASLPAPTHPDGSAIIKAPPEVMEAIREANANCACGSQRHYAGLFNAHAQEARALGEDLKRTLSGNNDGDNNGGMA